MTSAYLVAILIEQDNIEISVVSRCVAYLEPATLMYVDGESVLTVALQVQFSLNVVKYAFLAANFSHDTVIGTNCVRNEPEIGILQSVSGQFPLLFTAVETVSEVTHFRISLCGYRRILIIASLSVGYTYGYSLSVQSFYFKGYRR